MVGFARKLCGSVRVKRKKKKEVDWNDVLRPKKRIEKESSMEICKEEGEGRIYQSKKEANE